MAAAIAEAVAHIARGVGPTTKALTTALLESIRAARQGLETVPEDIRSAGRDASKAILEAQGPWWRPIVQMTMAGAILVMTLGGAAQWLGIVDLKKPQPSADARAKA